MRGLSIHIRDAFPTVPGTGGDRLGLAETRQVIAAYLSGVRSAIALRYSACAAGDAAALRFQVHFDLVAFGLRLAHEAWITELYERRGGDWRIVWEQATAIPNDIGLLLEGLKPPA